MRSLPELARAASASSSALRETIEVLRLFAIKLFFRDFRARQLAICRPVEFDALARTGLVGLLPHIDFERSVRLCFCTLARRCLRLLLLLLRDRIRAALFEQFKTPFQRQPGLPGDGLRGRNIVPDLLRANALDLVPVQTMILLRENRLSGRAEFQALAVGLGVIARIHLQRLRKTRFPEIGVKAVIIARDLADLHCLGDGVTDCPLPAAIARALPCPNGLIR